MKIVTRNSTRIMGLARPSLETIDDQLLRTQERCEVRFVMGELSFERVGSCVRVYGELDASAAGLLHDRVAAFAALSATPLNVDLSEVTFLDARGLSALIQLRDSIPSMRIVDISIQVRRTLEITGTADFVLAEDFNAPTA